MDSIPNSNLDPFQNFSDQNQNSSAKTKKILLIAGVIFVVAVIGGIYFWKGAFLKEKANELLLEYGFLYTQQESKIENTNPEASAVKAESDILFPVLVDGKWGYIDKAGKMVIEPKFDYAEDFYDGIAYIEIGNKKGFIDATSKMVFEMPDNVETHYPRKFPDGLIAVFTEKDDVKKYGYMNKKGEIVIPFEYDDVDNFSDGLAGVCKKYKESGGKNQRRWGYIDKTGKAVIEIRFIYAKEFSEGLAAVNSGGKWGYIDKAGKMVIEPKFANAKEFSEGLAAVNSGGKWGYIDKAGKMVIELKFPTVEDFSEGLAVVQNGIGGKYGFIDKMGNFVIKPLFYMARSFEDGLARVAFGTRDSKKDFFIDKNGKEIISLEPSQDVYFKPHILGRFHNSLLMIFIYDSESNDELGMKYVDKAGKVVWINQKAKKQQIPPNGKACPETISTATIKDLADAIILVIDNNCQTLASKFGVQSVFNMNTNGRDATKESLKKYGILVDQKFDEKKDDETFGRICFDFEGELMCSPISLYKDNNGNWIVEKL